MNYISIKLLSRSRGGGEEGREKRKKWLFFQKHTSKVSVNALECVIRGPASKENGKGLLAEFGGPFQLCHSLNLLLGLWARKRMSLLKGSSAFLFQTINDA